MSEILPGSVPVTATDGGQRREIRVRSMPFWRKRALLAGALRGALFHRNGTSIPIVHAGALIRAARGRIEIGHLSEIHERVALSAIAPVGEQAVLRIGRLTSIWYNTVVSARREILIGDQCAISWNCSILDDDMHELRELPGTDRRRNGPAPVHIGDHVWIGANSIVLKGVTIGENSVVAAGSIVTRDVAPSTLVAGAPAKTVRPIDGWF